MKLIVEQNEGMVGVGLDPNGLEQRSIGKFKPKDLLDWATLVNTMFGNNPVDLEIRMSKGGTYWGIFVSKDKANPHVGVCGEGI